MIEFDYSRRRWHTIMIWHHLSSGSKNTTFEKTSAKGMIWIHIIKCINVKINERRLRRLSLETISYRRIKRILSSRRMKRRDEWHDDWIKLDMKPIKKKNRAVDCIIDSIETYEDDPVSISVISPIFYETSLINP